MRHSPRRFNVKVGDGELRRLRVFCADSVEAMATLVSSGCFYALLPDHFVHSVWRLKNSRSRVPAKLAIGAA